MDKLCYPYLNIISLAPLKRIKLFLNENFNKKEPSPQPKAGARPIPKLKKHSPAPAPGPAPPKAPSPSEGAQPQPLRGGEGRGGDAAQKPYSGLLSSRQARLRY